MFLPGVSPPAKICLDWRKNLSPLGIPPFFKQGLGCVLDFIGKVQGKARPAGQRPAGCLSLSTTRLKTFGDYEFFKNIQVVTPTRKGALGIRELNKALQSVLNPPSQTKREKHYGEIIFREGDKVMQIKNNYDIMWNKKNDTKVANKGIFNGEFGIIKSIDSTEKTIKIEFDDEKEAYYEFSDLEQLDLAYAITIHKSQGSEFDVVILVISSNSPKLLTRNLLYTAITRAKKLLVVVGNDKVLQFMIQNIHTKSRNTGLKHKLKTLYS